MYQNLPKNILIKYPSGRWGFVGKVDIRLAWINKDGTEIDWKTAKQISNASNPSMVAKSRSFETRDQAIKFAQSLNLTIQEVENE